MAYGSGPWFAQLLGLQRRYYFWSRSVEFEIGFVIAVDNYSGVEVKFRRDFSVDGVDRILFSTCRAAEHQALDPMAVHGFKEFSDRSEEAFGQVRWVQTERSCDGIMTVHFDDLRHAEKV
ncbi:hypothetical protein RchiOBHm_Chr4g0428301 [Rosa chinensis]|uniref:Uncharacterized protein n=1 Tax=Rosa chinensis TaxID=74649 RepID=A0A2P6QZW1_ROSCH|nr:hypothetical protein RchiOBHm_Chr4g0428301 [Rosa chinensis]